MTKEDIYISSPKFIHHFPFAFKLSLLLWILDKDISKVWLALSLGKDGTNSQKKCVRRVKRKRYSDSLLIGYILVNTFVSYVL